MSLRVAFQFNAQDVLNRLLELRKRVVAKPIARRAMLNALEPMYQDAKARVPEDTGALKRGLLKQARAYGNGKVLGLVGFSRGRHKLRPGKSWGWSGPIRVTRYAHMVEFGVASRGRGQGPYPPHPMLRPALAAGISRFPTDFGRELMAALA